MRPFRCRVTATCSEVSGPARPTAERRTGRTPAALPKRPKQYARGILPGANRWAVDTDAPMRAAARTGAPAHLTMLMTRPAPTVRPPSRIAKRSPSSMAIGWISWTAISVLSPGMTISIPSGSVTTPVTSVVRK